MNNSPFGSPGGGDTDHRRLLLVVAICAGILLLWGVLFPQAPVAPRQPTPQEQAQGEAPSGRPEETAPTRKPDEAPPSPVIERRTLATLEASDRHLVELVNDDGQIGAWVLEEAQYRTRRPDGGEVPFRFVEWPEAPPALGVFLPPALNVRLDGRHARGEYRLDSSDGKTAALSFSDPASGVVITRRYTIDPEAYTVTQTIELHNAGSGSVEVALSALMRGVQNDREASGSMFTPPIYRFEGVCRHEKSFERAGADTVANWLADADDPTVFTGGVRWSGVDNRYFLTAAHLEGKDAAACEFMIGAEAAGMGTKPVGPHHSAVSVRMDLTPQTLQPGGRITETVVFYGGPKKLDVLAAQAAPMDDAIDFGIFAIICMPMLWLMRTFHGLGGNWGLAIILLTVLVKLITWPLTHKQYKSMAAMKMLQPHLKKLQEKYKDDKAKLQQEMMGLYREHKVNPLAGCLPMILMLPIYFSLYRTIYSAVELYQAEFIFWIEDLSQLDPYYVTPVLLGVLMFVQTRLNPTTGMDPTQQKIIMYVMPFFFTFMMLFLPSGLVLYIFVNTLLGIAQQYWLLRPALAQSTPPAPRKASA